MLSQNCEKLLLAGRVVELETFFPNTPGDMLHVLPQIQLMSKREGTIIISRLRKLGKKNSVRCEIYTKLVNTLRNK
jgi:hypothetical protein